jgi:arylsulfatase A-like enzyme/Tfp pilus assembly protein PilF
MRGRRVLWIALPLIAVVAGVIAIRCSPRPQHNLILVTLDTTRADHLGCYGHSTALTPTLDALAASGVRFDRAYATVTMTLPSHASLLTGLYPPEHGLHVNGRGRLARTIPTLATVLNQAGYDTGAFVAAYVLHSKYGLNQGFQTYDDDLAGGDRFGDESHVMRHARQMIDVALSWLEGHKTRPFFCWVHLFDPHAPFEGHEETFGDRFRETPYDGDIAFADQELKRLIDFLDENGLRDNTTIVVAGDHGEGFGEHGEREHGFLLYNSTLRVPLIISSPECKAAGHVESAPVSLIDVFPTLLDLLNVPARSRTSGTSLLPSLQREALPIRPCYSEADAAFVSFGWAPLQSITTDRWKYVRTTREELYDLSSDPHELNNLAGSRSDVLAEMQSTLAQVRGKMVEVPELSVQLSDAERRTLEGLGYLGTRGEKTPEAGATLPDVKDMQVHYNAEVDARKMIALGRFEDAERRLRETIAAAPDFMPARLTLGNLFQKQKRIGDAVEAYKAALERKPEHAEAHFDLARLLTDQRMLKEAIAHYLAAIQADPTFAMAHINLASLYVTTGDAVMARRHFEWGLEEFSDSSVGHFNFGMFLAGQGDAEGAREHVARAVQVSPRNAQLRYQFGVLLMSQERYADAVEQLQQALRIEPRHAAATALLERARNLLSERERASSTP